jgi:hypothetical protein
VDFAHPECPVRVIRVDMAMSASIHHRSGFRACLLQSICSTKSRHARSASAEDALDRLGPIITPQALKTFARRARNGIRTEGGGFRRDHLRALAQRVEVDTKEVRIMGSKSALLRTLVAASSAKTAGFGVPKWRATINENGHYCFAMAL